MGKKFFIKSMLHCQYACNYYKLPKMENLEDFLNYKNFDKLQMKKDKKLQQQLILDDSQFDYFCKGVRVVVTMFKNEYEGQHGILNTFIEKYKGHSKTMAEATIRIRTYNKSNKSNETETSDIGTNNNMVQVSPIQASRNNFLMENNNNNTDAIVNDFTNSADLENIQFSPCKRHRQQVEFLAYPPNHTANHSQRTQHKKRLKRHQSVPLAVEDPFEGKGLQVRSDDDDIMYEYNLWRDGFMVVDTGLFEEKQIPIRFIQEYFSDPDNRGILDLSKKKWIPCFNGENSYQNSAVTRWMSGIDIEDGFFDNTDLKDKVSICLCFYLLKHTYD